MIFEVEVRVKTTNHGGNTVSEQSLTQTYSFGENPRWGLAGATYAIGHTAETLIEKISNEIDGTEEASRLDSSSGKPKRIS